MRLGIDYLPAVAHASGPGRYARELVRALVRLEDRPELALYEVGRAARVLDERALGLAGAARTQRLVSKSSRALLALHPAPTRRNADLALGGVELFHRILPGTPQLARARTSIALARWPAPGSPAERAWRRELAQAALVFVFSTEFEQRCRGELGVDPRRLARVPVGCEHWKRELAAPPARADPPRVLVLTSDQPAHGHAAIRAAAAALCARGRRVELCFARETGAREEELPALVASASALVHLVPDAGTAVTPLEALALGTPVVLPRLPAFEEALGEQAFWCAEGALEHALEHALEAALDSARDEQQCAARAARAAPFSWESSARAHAAAWNALGA